MHFPVIVLEFIFVGYYVGKKPTLNPYGIEFIFMRFLPISNPYGILFQCIALADFISELVYFISGCQYLILMKMVLFCH